MNPFYVYSGQAYRSKQSNPDEIEALQTDVMRFVAILGFCLMVVFALVQSLPQKPKDDRPEIHSKQMLIQQVNLLQSRVRNLQLIAASEEKRLTSLIERRKIMEQEALTARQKLGSIKAEVREQGKVLSRISTDLDKKKQRLSSIKSKLQKKKVQVQKTELELERFRKDLAEKEKQSLKANKQSKPKQTAQKQKDPSKTEQKKETATQAQKPEPKKGFSLRFASEKVLQNLIRQGKVGFFAIHASQAWNLSVKDGQVAYKAASPPQKIYEMTDFTVPKEYKQALKRKVAVFDREKITWGVTLTSRSVAEIKEYLSSDSGGSLVIQGDGGVELVR